MESMQVLKNKCLRCGHKWVQRQDKRPKVCPKCKNAWWDEKRKDK